ncbi:MAG TPA: biotin/lipoate A/B protein ligase family protein [Thermoanaerobaculaceae bacterium]|nr:biotin/lipoate A/B protein ligase family protein [Thermoanaerobaculaceae bacterium]HRS17499.1 biotin/lipoate A/B protein ligase family protein [Thermoanaerobaculaceae bacterium]
MRWRLIVDGAGRGAHNMAVDEALVEAVDRGESPPVLRLYRWRPACLSLGFAQPYAAADATFCAAHGVDVVRRPTGGRAVLHHFEQTYCVLARLGEHPFSTDLQAAYRGICEALVAGLRTLGAPAGMAGAPSGGHIKPTEAVPCFIGPASGEVVAGGRKLIGSAMRRHNRSILQHGSLLEDWDGRLQAGCLGLDDDSSLRPAVTTLRDLLGTPPDPETLAAALVAGFEATFGVELEPSRLGEAERARAAFLARERYGHERWTVHRDRGLPPS